MIWLQRLRPWLNALLFLLLLLPLARWGWTVYLPKKVVAPAVEQILPVPGAQANTVDVSAILHTQLFGSAAIGNGGELPVTTLPLKLQGVVSVSAKAGSVAVFAGTDPKTRAAVIGQELQPGVTLRQVFKDYAVITNNGRNERVNLDVPPPLALNNPPGVNPANANTAPNMNFNNVQPNGPGIPMQTPAGQMLIQPAGPGQVMQGPSSIPAFPVPPGVGVPNLPPPYSNHQ